MFQVKVFNINTHESFVCESLSAASKQTGRALASIHKVIAGKIRRSGDYWFTKDLSINEMPVLRADKRFIDMIAQTESKKKVISQKLGKEEAKLEYQKVPKVKNKELAARAKKIYVENGKTVIYLESTVDQWTLPPEKIYETKKEE